MNITVAEYMVYYSQTWDLRFALQSIDRNYRIGTKNNVYVYYLLCNNTIDEIIQEKLKQKMKGVDNFAKEVDLQREVLEKILQEE